jgi:hypothetical protein
MMTDDSISLSAKLIQTNVILQRKTLNSLFFNAVITNVDNVLLIDQQGGKSLMLAIYGQNV